MSRKLSKCKNVRRAGDLKSMSSKTILLGLSIFRCGSDVHGRPSWELAPYDRESERTKDFTAWCRDASTECCFNERAGECGVVRFTSQFFVLGKSKSIPIRIGGQTGWEAMGGHHRQKYKPCRQLRINRNGLIVLCRMV